MMETSLQKKLDSKNLGESVICVAVVPKGGFSNDKTCQFPLYWITGFNVDDLKLLDSLKEVLADELIEEIWTDNPRQCSKWLDAWKSDFAYLAERQFLPGVTDNLGKTVEEALKLAGVNGQIQVASGQGLLFANGQYRSIAEVEKHCRYEYFHPLTDRFVVHELKDPGQGFLGFPKVNLPDPKKVQVISLDVSDAELMRISKDGVLALNLN